MVLIAMTMLVAASPPARVHEGSATTLGDLIPAPPAVPDDPFGATGQVVDIDSLDATAPPPGAITPIGQPTTPTTTVPSQLGVPGIVLDAYRVAATRLAITNPSCHLSWSLLAGIGRLESSHARGGRVDASGTTLAPILGPPLSGGPGMARILDTDHGALDHDSTYDRAVGPMQFIPSTWSTYGVDGNGDHHTSPHNVYDAATAAGRYLCSGGMDLANPAQRYAAVFRYNHAHSYVRTVLSWATAYDTGGTALTPLPTTSPAQALIPLLSPTQTTSTGPLALHVLPLAPPPPTTTTPPPTPTEPPPPTTTTSAPPAMTTPQTTTTSAPPTTTTEPPPSTTTTAEPSPPTTSDPPPPATTQPPPATTEPSPPTTGDPPLPGGGGSPHPTS